MTPWLNRLPRHPRSWPKSPTDLKAVTGLQPALGSFSPDRRTLEKVDSSTSSSANLTPWFRRSLVPRVTILSRRTQFDGLEVELVDTAGFGHASNSIEAAALEAGERQATDADLLVRCHSRDTEQAEFPFFNAQTIDIWTKADLSAPPLGWLSTSAATGDGIEALKTTLASMIRLAPF